MSILLNFLKKLAQDAADFKKKAHRLKKVMKKVAVMKLFFKVAFNAN